MTYYERIDNLIAEIKHDNSVLQPWKNKAVSALQQAQACVFTGQGISSRKDEAKVDSTASKCVCPDGAWSRKCPEHGHLVPPL